MCNILVVFLSVTTTKPRQTGIGFGRVKSKREWQEWRLFGNFSDSTFFHTVGMFFQLTPCIRANCLNTRICTDAERALLRRLEGGCQTPIAAHATLAEDHLTLHAMIASLDGSTIIGGTISGLPAQAEEVGNQLAEDLIERGGKGVLGRGLMG